MKKVEKVSIAEISFTLDNDAYLALKQYLDSLHVYYDNDPDGREIIADIEARIAELILEEQVYTKVVSRPLVETIIAQLGTPDQIDNEAGEGAENSENSESDESDGVADGDDRYSAGGTGRAYASGGSTFSGASGTGSFDASIPRRLHRSAEGKILGGVCSGIAKYLDISVAWVRLVFLAPLVLRILALPFHWIWFRHFSEGWAWVFFVTYIVLWIALPMAKTPRQKLEARGEKITPESIRHTMQGAATTPAGRKAASVGAELVTVLGRVVLFFVKFVMAVVGFVFMFAAIAVFMTMVVVLINPESAMVNNVSVITLFEGMSLLSPLWFVELALLCALLPLFVLGMALLSFTFNWRLGRVFYGVTLGGWAIAMIFFGIVAISNARFFHYELPDRVAWWSENGVTRGKWSGDGEWRVKESWRRSRSGHDSSSEHDPGSGGDSTFGPDSLDTAADSLRTDNDGYKDSVTNRVKITRIE